MLDYKQYVVDAARTDTDYVAYDQALTDNRIALSLLQFLTQARQLLFDAWKKFLFYGKVPDGGLFRLVPHNNRYLTTEQALFRDRLRDPKVRRLLHGALGRITEGLEILEAVEEYSKTGSLNYLNIAEESGDGKWYDGRIDEVLAEEGFDLDRVFSANIEKLRARYPDKFNTQDATERDLNAEDRALRQNLQTKDDLLGDDQ